MFPYTLTEKTEWKILGGSKSCKFEGRMIGGCLDVLCKLLGTKYAPVEQFISKYKNDGFVWALESCEMNAADIYRTLWQMRECGWFRHCRGFLIGRPADYSDKYGFALADALEAGLGGLKAPVVYDADVGHVPPQLQLINGAYANVVCGGGAAEVKQVLIG